MNLMDHNKMETQQRSVTADLPTEIWWVILEFALEATLFATTYEGDNWALDANSKYVFMRYMNEYFESERERKRMRRVCRSWKEFADARSNRFVDLHTISSPIRDDYTLDKETIAHARCGRILPRVTSEEIARIADGVKWEVAIVSKNHAKILGQVPHASLRRLDLSIDAPDGFDPNSFLEILGSYRNLTWLTLSLDDAPNKPPLPLIPGKTPFVLPSLQTFVVRSRKAWIFPSFCLTSPNLRHLFLKSGTAPKDITLRDLISHYCQTLRSIAIVTGASLGRVRDQYFPPWTECPELEELALDPALIVDFHPLPRTHPLRRIYTSQWTHENLKNWLDSDNLKHIALVNAKLFPDGIGWMNGALTEAIGTQNFELLNERAREKGIEMTNGGNWNSW
ncbi:hypothetical protein FRC17_001349 [Serendipita sp. 399]|nr:hypothetical protein FRC17_001349 [Serendipita sp. 399]